MTTGADCSAAVTWAANTNQAAPANGWPPPSSETTPTANGADRMRWTAETAYVVFDWCYDQWSSTQISSFVSANQTWVANVDEQCWGGVRGGVNNCPYSQPQSNYYQGNERDDIEFGIVTYGDNGSGLGSNADNDIVNGLNRWSIFKTAYSAIPNGYGGGVGAEGTDYETDFSLLLFPFETMELGGRDIFSECDYLRQFMVYYAIYGTTPALTISSLNSANTYAFFDYGDNEGTQDYGSILDMNNTDLYWQNMLNFAAGLWASAGNTGSVASLLYNNLTSASATGRYHTTFAADPWFVAVDSPAAPASSFSALPLDYYATGLQYAFLRTAWDTSSAAIMLQMGYEAGGSHSHQDRGSYTIWRGGRWVDRETTGYSQTIAGTPSIDSDANQGTSSPFAHNVPVFTNVVLGQTGSSCLNCTMPAPNPSPYTPVYRLGDTADYFYADVDLTNLYLWDSNYSQYQTGVVGHVEREFVYVRPLETLVVFDRLLTQNQTLGGSLTATQVVTTYLNHCETRPTVIDSQDFNCTDGTQEAEQTVLEPISAAYRVVNESSCAGCSSGVGQYRIEIDNSGTVQRYDLDVIQSYPNTGCKLAAKNTDSNPGDPTTGTFTVTLTPYSGTGCSTPGSPTTIVFTKALCSTSAGECSKGGTINVAGAGQASLPTGVESISYTDNGPVWGGLGSPPPLPPTGLTATVN